MDYRYYRGDGIELPPIITRNLHWLRYIGAAMVATPPLLGVLMLLDILNLTLFWFFASFLIGNFGSVFFVIGMAYDTVMDRGSTKIVLRWSKLLGRKQEPNEFRPGRRMIYDHYVAPEAIIDPDPPEKNDSTR